MQRKIGIGLTYLLTLALLLSAAMKLSGSEEVVKGFDKMNLGQWREIIALGEITGAILFVIPRTWNFGALVLSGYMGGAIMAHMTQGEPFTAPAIFLILVWAAAFLKEPQMYRVKAGSLGSADHRQPEQV